MNGRYHNTVKIDNGVIVTLTLEDNQDTRAIWPHKFHNQMTFEMSSELNVSLTSTNTDTQPWSYGGALHTYFDIADINNTSVTGMGSEYLDSTQAGKECHGTDVLTFELRQIVFILIP